jgi:hypothetical protein
MAGALVDHPLRAQGAEALLRADRARLIDDCGKARTTLENLRVCAADIGDTAIVALVTAVLDLIAAAEHEVTRSSCDKRQSANRFEQLSGAFALAATALGVIGFTTTDVESALLAR